MAAAAAMLAAAESDGLERLKAQDRQKQLKQGWTATVVGAEKITAGTIVTETDEECTWLKPSTRAAVVPRMSSTSSGDGVQIAATASSTYVRYQLVLVAPSGERFVRQKRYSAFRELHKALLSVHPDSMGEIKSPFPPKTYISTGSAVVKERVRQLNDYFAEVFQHRKLSQCITLRTALHVTDGLVWYRTLSSCPISTICDRDGIVWEPAEVVELRGKVYLHVFSPKYGDVYTILCNNARFFERVSRRQMRCATQSPNCHRSLGELCQNAFPHTTAAAHPAVVPGSGAAANAATAALRHVAQRLPETCAVLDVTLFDQNAYLSDRELDDVCLSVAKSSLAIRLETKLADDIPMINAKLLHIAELMKGRTVIADMPHDRLIQLAALPNTALVKRCITPAVTYYLRRFEEAQCHQELVETLSALSRVTGIDVFVTIHVEYPFPELDSLLTMLRNHNDKVRLIRLVVSRPMKQIVHATEQLQCFKLQNTPFTPNLDTPHEPSVDFYELLEQIDAATSGDITPDDFVALSSAALLEPLVETVKQVRVTLRPCDTTGALAVLVPNATGGCGNLAANAVVDMEMLLTLLEPVLATRSKTGPRTPLSLATAIRKALKQSLRPGPEAQQYLDRFLAGVTATSSKVDGSNTDTDVSHQDWVARSQLLLVQRAIDVAALDVEHVLAPVEYSKLVRSLLEEFQ
eukprot:m.832793 g.832793  ORF g.832793 m.832793 type:complete len:692 (+) comp23440_c0_seq2:168-2243(+)